MRRNTASDFTGTSTEVLPPDDNAANEDATGTVFAGNTYYMLSLPVMVWETSGNTTARTYSPFWRIGGGTGYLNRIESNDYQSVSTMTVMEIAA